MDEQEYKIEIEALKERLEESEGKIKNILYQRELILKNAGCGLVFINPKQEIVWDNIKIVFPNLIDKDDHCFVKRTLCINDKSKVSLPNHLKCEFCTIIRTINEKKIIRSNKRLNNGQIVEVVSVPFFDNEKFIGIVMRIEDITERVAMNDQLKRALEKAEKSDQIKTSFIANISHEIRTPLNAIVGFSEYVQTAQDEQDRKMYQSLVHSNTEHLLAIVNDLLDLSKLESGDMDSAYTSVDEPFDIEALMQEKKEMWRHKTDNKIPITYTSQHDYFFVMSDPHRLAQVMNNFLSNAVKFTSQGSIEIGYKYEDDTLKLYCKDTGIGISEEDQKMIFDKFTKVDYFVTGMGIGLSICERIAKLKGGRIEVESKKGVGSTFWCIIPCKEVEL